MKREKGGSLRQRKEKKGIEEEQKERDERKKTHRPRLMSRKARPISPARFSRAAARISEEEGDG